MSNTYVNNSDIHGKGLFAWRNVSVGTGIIIIEGEETMTWSPKIIDVGYAMIVPENNAQYINHSSSPNSVVIGNVLYATRDILPDEEITFSYDLSRSFPY